MDSFQISNRLRETRVRAGFTLVEILVVMVVMLVILTVSFTGLGGAMRGLALTDAGNKFTQLCDAARQRAMSANVLTAVVAVTALGVPEDGRAFCILECPPGGPWKQTREWEFIPDGMTLDLSTTTENLQTFAELSPAVFPFNGGTTGAPVGFRNHNKLAEGTYAARIFLPGGSLKNASEPARFQIVEGVSSGGETTYSQVGDGQTPVNYYRITLIGATGGTKVERP
ncbi:prepilin-type N-terminal cleavage/methylation domain-containing protein [Phragmitibacter flavus]|uniref:Prepilin-type N-terminal cleavage/methylation domain-containing protein n=1 Tax=Phragmitibacter flavus TaxID=2576071 RepID=A0A5R8KEH0_9BACT|nr:prepilin-type N-terminal cleavage/methylation domain-containing protein [Phragmitibacter flavus]TLD70693.1 prepilin-type N-terminal cleavage/methylation domain-containing protein [Phragmitibacter flavus]